MSTGFAAAIAEAERPRFRKLTRTEGYLPIKDFGLIGDGSTAGLIGADGSVGWLCIPDFDSDPLLCGILDTERGGVFRLSPDDPVAARQFYLPDTGVLITELQSNAGVLQCVDALALLEGADLHASAPSARGQLVRSLRVTEGEFSLALALEPRGGAQTERQQDSVLIRPRQQPDLKLSLCSSRGIAEWPPRWTLEEGERLSLLLDWSGKDSPEDDDPEELLEHTWRTWLAWARAIRFEGSQRKLVRRSIVTLRLLDYSPNGALVAAPTSSLPEVIGGVRNWDYRYAWIRDAAFSVYALHRVGLVHEADEFLGWVLHSIKQEEHPRVVYTIRGEPLPPERIDQDLRGYRGSSPVRWGNAAADQWQHDVYGEVLDCAFQLADHGNSIGQDVWPSLLQSIEGARREWQTRDHGIWEVRSAGAPFTYSAAMCHVALDRGARLARQFSLSGDTRGWELEASRIRDTILEEAWNPEIGAIAAEFHGKALDASLLSLPLRRVIPAEPSQNVGNHAPHRRTARRRRRTSVPLRSGAVRGWPSGTRGGLSSLQFLARGEPSRARADRTRSGSIPCPVRTSRTTRPPSRRDRPRQWSVSWELSASF